MSAAFTVLLPHKRNPGNNAALAIALSCLQDNTVKDFILLMDAAVDQPLNERVNRMVQAAPTDCCVYTASDMFMAREWDREMLAIYNSDTFVTNVVIEPRAIALHPMNLEANFGMRPETFRRAQFEEFCKTAPVLSGEGWFAPVMFSRQGFLDMGGLALDGEADAMGFTAADMLLFEKWKATGHTVKRAPSFCYHLQRYSDIGEQEHGKRAV